MSVPFRRLVVSGVLLTLLSGCASVLDTPNQTIHILTPGAKDARCVLATDDFRAVAYPPQKIVMRRMPDQLVVTCTAPGNREKTIVVPAAMNKVSSTGVPTVGVGSVYDHFSGALYEYPERIVVDFTHTRARMSDLPGAHARDTVSPFDVVNEDMMDRPAQTPADQGLKTTAPKKRAAFSKEDPSVHTAPSDIVQPY